MVVLVPVRSAVMAVRREAALEVLQQVRLSVWRALHSQWSLEQHWLEEILTDSQGMELQASRVLQAVQLRTSFSSGP
jgi:hypothetical protein